jgi:hypothetical protein
MEKRALIADMRIAHALFNVTILIFLVFQAWLGLKIRKQRKAGTPPVFSVIRTHRKWGSILIQAGVLGFLSGGLLIYADYGYLFKYPYHSLTGLTIALILLITFAVSKKIKGIDSPWRIIHYRIGLLLLCIYGFQAFLGIGILF